jgi:hypothetical protein
MKQTATEFLFEKLWDSPKDKLTWHSILKQAKEMERQKMIEFAQLYAVIHCMGDITKDAEQFYKETYGK